MNRIIKKLANGMRPSAWRRAGSSGTEGRVRLDVGEKFFPVRVDEALAQVALA